MGFGLATAIADALSLGGKSNRRMTEAGRRVLNATD